MAVAILYHTGHGDIHVTLGRTNHWRSWMLRLFGLTLVATLLVSGPATGVAWAQPARASQVKVVLSRALDADQIVGIRLRHRRRWR